MFLPLVLLMSTVSGLSLLVMLLCPRRLNHGMSKMLLEYGQILEEVRMQKGWIR